MMKNKREFQQGVSTGNIVFTSSYDKTYRNMIVRYFVYNI